MIAVFVAHVLDFIFLLYGSKDEHPSLPYCLPFMNKLKGTEAISNTVLVDSCVNKTTVNWFKNLSCYDSVPVGSLELIITASILASVIGTVHYHEDPTRHHTFLTDSESLRKH